MKVNVKIEGEREILASIRRLGDAGDQAALRVFTRVLARVIPKAKAEAPVEAEDGGALRDSIRATRPNKTRAGRLSAGVVAGGLPLRRLATERGRALPGSYGSIQHEDLTKKHAVGHAKFLERPFFQEAPKVPDELLAEIDLITSKESA